MFPEVSRRENGKGRPRQADRAVMDGILWVLRTGAPWQDLPERDPYRATRHRRFRAWARDGTLEGVLKALAEDLRDKGGLELSEAFIDGSFAGAKKGRLRG